MKELIEKAEKLDRDATPGPWDTYEDEITAGDNLLFKAGHRSQATAYDMLFVSQARTLLPALAAELRKLTAVLVAAEDTAKSYLATSLRLERERDAARAEIRRLTELRPIAEAPRDGTWVLGIAPGYGRPVAVRWDSDRWAADSDADEYQITIEPTHFLPLSDGMPR